MSEKQFGHDDFSWPIKAGKQTATPVDLKGAAEFAKSVLEELLNHADMGPSVQTQAVHAIDFLETALSAKTPEAKAAPYGFCPKCGAAGVTRERRPNGNDKCGSGQEGSK